jgi:two-component system sensor histidine kinase DegS
MTASDWVQALEEAEGELGCDLQVLRELAADAAVAQVAAERRGELRLAETYRQQAEASAAAIATLLRHGERLKALRERAAGGPASGSSPGASVGLTLAQEEERRRLARDIHDGPAQLLANVVFRIDVAQTLLQGDPARARAELEQLKHLVRHSLQDVRKIIFDLRPLALDDLGLIPALRGYLGGLQERAGLKVDLHVAGDPRRLPTALEVALFRLVQEALHNVRKHAGTDAADVRVEFGEAEVRVTVADRGRGFDPGAAAGASDRLGLRSMRERAELFGGSLTLRSSPGRGTVVAATFPIPVAAAV